MAHVSDAAPEAKADVGGDDTPPPQPDIGAIQRLSDVYRHGNRLMKETLSRSIDKKTLAEALEAEFPRRRLHRGYMKADLAAIRLPDPAPPGRPRHLYRVGTAVEHFDAGAQWRPGRVTRVIEQVKDEFDWEGDEEPTADDYHVFYNVDDMHMVPATELSLPIEFLLEEFGLRPLLWQQWAMLRLEERLRFQEDHPRDFMELDATEFGKKLWKIWLDHFDNRDFREKYDVHPFRDYLRERMLHPFRLIDMQTTEGGDWNVDESSNVSVYSYLSVLGAGGWMCACVFFVQILLPVALYFVSIDQPESRTFDPGYCSNEGTTVSKAVLFAVMLIYLIRVVPETMSNFLRTAGALDDPMSRTMSLRRVIWIQGDDTMFQRFGYALDVTMNTAYAALLYGLNILILYNTPPEDATDLILNALAIEFIHTLDEEIVDTSWWDPTKRFLKAGSVELTIRSTLRLHYVSDWRSFCKAFEVEEDAYQKALFGFSSLSLKDRAVATEDMGNPDNAVDNEDVWWLQLAALAVETRNARALAFFEGLPATFERVSLRKIARAALNWFSPRSHGVVGPDIIFGRYSKYYTWSKWEKVMFLPPPQRRGRGLRGRAPVGLNPYP